MEIRKLKDSVIQNLVVVTGILDLIRWDENGEITNEYVIVSFRDSCHSSLPNIHNHKFIEVRFDDEKYLPKGETEDTFFKDAEQVAEFIKIYVDCGKKVICQCSYGVSRSAGCAAAILENYLGSCDEIIQNHKYNINQSVYKGVLRELKEKTKL